MSSLADLPISEESDEVESLRCGFSLLFPDEFILPELSLLALLPPHVIDSSTTALKKPAWPFESNLLRSMLSSSSVFMPADISNECVGPPELISPDDVRWVGDGVVSRSSGGSSGSVVD